MQPDPMDTQLTDTSERPNNTHDVLLGSTIAIIGFLSTYFTVQFLFEHNYSTLIILSVGAIIGIGLMLILTKLATNYQNKPNHSQNR